MNMIRIKILKAFPLFILSAIFIASCDETFEPIKDNADTPFSIFGYLESPVDSNWIRISEVRRSLYTEKDATIDATVTLEHLESGQTETMRDLLFRVEEEFYAFNFLSTMSLEPEQSYLLKVIRSDGKASSVKVTLPETFPDPEITIHEDDDVAADIYSIENLAAVDFIYEVRNDVNGDIKHFTFHHLHDIYEEDQERGDYRLGRVSASRHRGVILEYYAVDDHIKPHTILKKELYIASAGPEWIHFPSLDEQVRELPEVGNVENGAGYLVGIVSRRFPLELTGSLWQGYP